MILKKIKLMNSLNPLSPYLEKAVQYNPKDTYILDQLKNLYYRLKMMDKFDAINKK